MCNRSVLCVYFGFWQSRFYFSISDVPPNFLGFVRQWRHAGPDRTGPGQLPAVTAALAPSTVLYCVRSCLLVVFVYFFYHWLLLQSDTAVQKHFYPGGWVQGGGAEPCWLTGDASWVSFAVLEWTTVWQTEPAGRSLAGGRVPSIRHGHSSFQHSCRVSRRLYAICFAHCVHIYIDVRHIFLYTCTTDGISIL